MRRTGRLLAPSTPISSSALAARPPFQGCAPPCASATTITNYLLLAGIPEEEWGHPDHEETMPPPFQLHYREEDQT
jgi:hypothetical protein